MFGAWLVRFHLLGVEPADGVPNRKPLLPVLLFFALILFQLLPFPAAVMERVSPGTSALYTRCLSYLTGTGEATALPPLLPPSVLRTASVSIGPSLTRREALLLLTYLGLFFLLLNYRPDGSVRRFVRRLIITIGVTSVIVAGIGLAQRVLRVPHIYGFWTPEQQSTLDFMGPYVNANHFAGYMELTLPIVFALFAGWARNARFLRAEKRGWNPLQDDEVHKVVLVAVGVGLLVVAFLLSFSRAGMFAFFVSTCCLFALFLRWERRFRAQERTAGKGIIVAGLCVFAFLVAFFILLAFGKKSASPLGETEIPRFEVWRNCLEMVADFPLWGVGLGDFSLLYPEYKKVAGPAVFTHAENDYLQLLVETGAVGFLLVLWFFLVFFRELRRTFTLRVQRLEQRRAAREESGGPPKRYLRYTRSPQEKDRHPYPMPTANYFLFLGCLGALLSLLLHSFADFNLHIPANALLFSLLLALSYRILRLNRRVFSFASRRQAHGGG